MTEYAILAVLLRRALGRDLPAFLVGVAYAASDELHQHFVAGRHASPVDVGDRCGRARARACSHTAGTRRGERARARARPRRRARRHAPAVAASGSRTRRAACGSTSSTSRTIASRPRPSSTSASANWQVLLERFAEDRAPVYFRPNADVSAALRRLQAPGREPRRLHRRSGAARTDRPRAPRRDPAPRRVGSRPRALERLLARLGPETAVLHTRAELLSSICAPSSNTCPLLARDHAARCRVLNSADSRYYRRSLRPCIAWCSRPRS